MKEIFNDKNYTNIILEYDKEEGTVLIYRRNAPLQPVRYHDVQHFRALLLPGEKIMYTTKGLKYPPLRIIQNETQ